MSHAAASRRPRGRRLLLLLEYFLLFAGLPVAYVLDWVPVPVIPALWLLAAIFLSVLLAAPDFERRRLWNGEHLRRRLRSAAFPFVLAAPLLALLTAVYAPERLLGFVRREPLLWAAVMVLYPVLSAYPQGIIYRAFIFHRYRRLFPGRWTMILASAASFSMVHVVFENWIAPVLALFGGVLFAWTYERTRSSLVATFQHALFGCFVFTIGLGWFFFHGAVGR